MPAVAVILALPMTACEGLLEVDLPGSLTEDALLIDPTLSETLVTSAVTEFECGFVDYTRYPGQWFEEWQNTSQSRPDALSQFRSALVGVYADPCSSGTGPIWTTVQVPRLMAARAVEFIRFYGARGDYAPTNAVRFPNSQIPDTTFLIAKARLYEGYSIQLLAEQFCAVTLTPPSVIDPPSSGGLVTREAAYDSAEVKFTEAINYALAVTNPAPPLISRFQEAQRVLNAARVGRARARLYQWEYGGKTAGLAADVVADAGLVISGAWGTGGGAGQLVAEYDANPARRRNRHFVSNNQNKAMMPYKDYTALRIAADGTNTVGGEPLQGTTGVADPRVTVNVAASASTDPDGRGVFPMRRQGKFANNAADIPFSSWREARLMIAEVDPTQTLAIINNLRTVTTGLPAGVTLPNCGVAPAFVACTISAGTWAGLGPAGQQATLREERRRELWMQGHQPGDKIRWAYPAWDSQDEYSGALRNVTTIDDPLTTAATYPLTGGVDRPGCIPIPYLERQSNSALLAILGT
jgi:hypothetical protein